MVPSKGTDRATVKYPAYRSLDTHKEPRLPCVNNAPTGAKGCCLTDGPQARIEELADAFKLYVRTNAADLAPLGSLRQ